ncbi:MAG: undecaprenyl/decaprenyl-phosphate alpha-N-acetylglucosaminyl 1-phosphate transferase [Endomicrobia bacterium]|nr:undecaprenyl/decaprenyl-phosphate alpha-N-acetylglucosaminyl 1-phosphate transferase [Endomicrobiia bacterium]MCX7940601.1 undecaprenyl/decaprenyl-phosphate alpha-N-acetylglucosaminyl 1-phosphate transferase [Endomicrobiia bacterium]MDW8055329.1 MraY family glycosyltransferase [Elusimicrobiota bacterium]
MKLNFSFSKIVLFSVVLSFIFIREIGRQAYLIGIRWVYLLLLSAGLSYLLTPFAIWIANKFNILDYPSERKIHSLPTPRVGGIAIFFAIVITLLRNVQFTKEIISFLVAICIIFLVGFLDDVYDLPASLRLAVQIITSLIIIFFGYRITAIPRGFPFEHLLEVIITVVWFVGIINAVAFLDGIDGLVSGFGAFCSTIFLVIALTTGQKHLSYLCAVVAGSCLGFLPYNWYKAKTFLGECGATVVGFMLASISVIGWWSEEKPIVSLTVPVLVLSVPIYDMIYITISRIVRGEIRSVKEWLEYTGKDHIHHRLLNLGFPVPYAVVFILLTTLSVGFYSLFIKYFCPNDFTAVLLLVQVSLVFILITIIMITSAKKKNEIIKI